MKILIALDDSPHSEQALEFVTRMRWPAGSRMIVLSVLQPAVSAVAGPYEPAPVEVDVMAEQRRLAEELVFGAEARLREYGFSTEGRVLMGDAREVLTEEARTQRADLLVMGSHGRTGIAKLMLGSVSSHIVTHASCSVLVVKSGCGEAQNRHEKGAGR
jgi:nucleotide-binding universal stress UspA family protein